jgi:hypothetical protein
MNPRVRIEKGSPEGYPQTEPYEGWRRHDEYGESRGRVRTDSRGAQP